MKLVVEQKNLSLKVSLTTLRIAGLWAPDDYRGFALFFYHCHTFLCLMFLSVYLAVQLVDLYQVWGDISLMTGAAFVLCTNLAHSGKIGNILVRRRRIGALVQETGGILALATGEEEMAIVKSCCRECSLLQGIYIFLTTVTGIGWAASAEKGNLPLPRARYPYDTSKSPAFELTFIHQVVALMLAAYINIAKDTLVAGLIAQIKCQLQLLNHRLQRIHEGMGLDENVNRKSVVLFTPSQEKLALARLRSYVKCHQRALELAPELQSCFSGPTFAQFAVSLVIICVTAFQLSKTKNLIRFLSMGTYLLNMTFQVFIYCYQGNQLREESLKMADGAYSSLWCHGSVRLRRSVLLVMTRARRPLVIMAGGYTALSLASFTAIVKASYSFFMVLQQVTQE